MMKRTIIAVIHGTVAITALGQGTIDVGNAQKDVFIQPIFAQNQNFFVESVGSPSTSVYNGALPAGTTVYGGLPLRGSGYDMVFFYSLNNSVTSINQMSVGTIAPFRTAPVATAAPAGTIVTMATVPIPGTTGGTPIAFAFGAFIVDPTVLAFEAANPSATPGQIWSEALADIYSGDPLADYGFGNIVSGVQLGGVDTADGLHPEPTTFEGWTSFSLYPQPEPSSFAIMGLGGGVLLLGRRFIAGLRKVPRSISTARDRPNYEG
jgi:hypothetical protein